MAVRRAAGAALATVLGTALGAAIALAAPSVARAQADEFDGASVIFARGAALYRVDPRGKGETEIAQLPARTTVRALRSDARGRVLLADLAGKWAWMPLDGSARALIELPCGDGPAALAEDGSAVLCRSPKQPRQSILVELAAAAAPPRVTALDVPPGAARLVGSGAERKLVWADQAGVWTAPAADPRRKARAALDVPLRGFLASPDGAHAIGVYTDQVFADMHHQRAAEVLMTLQLDGQGARRKAIRDGVAVEWSHDARWLLVQDGASTCIMRVSGGQYKCWRGLTAASLSADGRWALALGNRDGSRQTAKSGKGKSAARPGHPAPPTSDDSEPHHPDDKPWDHPDEPWDEPESADAPPPIDDVSVALPTGPLALYRLRLEGAFTDRPTLLVKVIDGAAVWIPGSP
ncbi:MAG TPA: hypothetical protein VHW23_03705 [Kofleriaceae bacterium]|jgi:hypothetical protein|nr:hypothetical protein [Kofleriaceae bacterium]